MSQNIKGALRVLLSEIVDYAGLFPPAQLSMRAAVENFNQYLNGEFAWMLGRFIVPANRLNEFVECAEDFWNGGNKTWRVSLLAKDDLRAAASLIENFNRKFNGKAVIDALETVAADAAHIKQAKQFLPENVTAYFELPLAPQLPEQISALAVNKLRAKVRTGGVAPEAFPPIDELVKFLRVCLAANVPFKATAGLHHPLRAVKPLTYDKGAPLGTMHGFLNLFLATAFMRQNLNGNLAHKIMAETDARNFKFDDDAAQWNGNSIDLQQLQLTRARNIVSFGSCSFVEPVEDLKEIGLL